MTRLRLLLVLLVGARLRLVQGVKWCPPLDTALPAPTNVAAHPAIRSAVAQLTEALNAATAGTHANVTYLANVTSSSVGAASPFDAPGVHLFQHHHAALSRNTSAGGGHARPIDGDSVYRIGSVSKVLTVFALLRQAELSGRLTWGDAVTKHLPELASATARGGGDEDPVDRIRWEQVTLRGLSCHLAGLPRDWTFQDLSVINGGAELAASLGLPPLSASELPTCGSTKQQTQCSQKEYLEGASKMRPIFPPLLTPSYSNVAFSILGTIIERVSRKSYDAAVTEIVIQPLGLNRTSIFKPRDDSLGVIAINSDDWDYDFGNDNPTGGYYMSLNDVLAFGRAVLASSHLPRVVTRRWLKPCANIAATADNPAAAVSAPWEMQRQRALTPDGRTIDVYAKGGNLQSYVAYLAVVPDPGFVVAALVVAPPSAPKNAGALGELVLRAMAPAVDAVARDQARRRYAGVYVARDDDVNATMADGGAQNSTNTLRLEVDDGPGLRVAALDVRGVTQQARFRALGLGRNLPTPAWRLYPAGLRSSAAAAAPGTRDGDARSGNAPAAPPSASAVYREGFRAQIGDETPGKTDYAGRDLCAGQWASPGWPIYRRQPIDEFVVHVDAASGRAVRVEAPAFKLVFERVRGGE